MKSLWDFPFGPVLYLDDNHANRELWQWLLQAHLSTESYKDAAVGLKRVRRFRRLTFWFRYPSALLVIIINNLLSACRLRETGKRTTLLWSKEQTYKPTVRNTIMRLTSNVHCLPLSGVSEEETPSNLAGEEGKCEGDAVRVEIFGVGAGGSTITEAMESQPWDEEKGRVER